VAIAIVAIVWFPDSPVAVVAGWAIYLVFGLLVSPWGMIMLAVGAAIAAIWWTLSRPPGSYPHACEPTCTKTRPARTPTFTYPNG
jgi:NhaP-type Na+/H+ and K+/H+ antiporter